jgi:hypothetical protein
MRCRNERQMGKRANDRTGWPFLLDATDPIAHVQIITRAGDDHHGTDNQGANHTGTPYRGGQG